MRERGKGGVGKRMKIKNNIHKTKQSKTDPGWNG